MSAIVAVKGALKTMMALAREERTSTYTVEATLRENKYDDLGGAVRSTQNRETSTRGLTFVA